MPDHQPPVLEYEPNPQPEPPRVLDPNWSSGAAGLLLVILLIGSLWFWLRTGAAARVSEPMRLYEEFRPFVSRHIVLASLAYVGIYVLLSLLALPIWWLEMLAGLGFGLYQGSLLSLIGSTIGAVLTVGLTRWIAADWFHERIERRLQQLEALDNLLGHNGLLVVMTIRLVHLLPFGICNYALGLTKVSYTDVLLGTFLGGIPAAALYVGIGAHYHPLTNWRFDTILGAINIFLLLPLILRYLRPKWFARMGIE